MSPKSNSPSPETSWRPEVLDAVRATPAPLYAVAYPAAPEQGWHISLLQGEGELRGTFAVADLEAADRELRRRGYLSLSSAMRRDWDRLTERRTEEGRGTPVFDDPEADL
ncbi:MULTISPECIES: hypothetical protein [Streptomyces]|uniref:hypothetical protein n=1 Tax=Streptomyces TaxID=1883 RepID=UPI001C94431B|nr:MULTISPECIES: hypothetical protein [Streptomyces]MDI7790798.1 hypothetical protein [Streptomyces cavourensis]